MATVYTIEGARARRRRGGRSGGRSAQQKRFSAAAKACKGRKKGAFRACMKAKLRG